MIIDVRNDIKFGKTPPIKRIKKLGTLKIDCVETTPIVWNDRLIRFEWVRHGQMGCQCVVKREVGYYAFFDMETEEQVGADFGMDHSFGACYAENGTMYVIGVRGNGGGNILDLFWSDDLVNWQEKENLRFDEDLKLYNTSICKAEENEYALAIEIGGTHPMVGGHPFTIIFAKSSNLFDWEVLPTDTHVFARARYTACPSIRYYDGFYYMVYLEGLPALRWPPYVVRTKDFEEFEIGLNNPFMMFDDNDKLLVHPERFSELEKARIYNAVDCNNSDVDFCDYNGKAIILYSWGNQHGVEFLAMAEYDGTLKELLTSFFPDQG
jgi:hypothetical protein